MSTVLETLFTKLDEKKDRMIEIRRYLHENPELSFQEEETAKYIASFYEGKDVDIRTGVGKGQGANGIVVTIDTGHPGKTIAIRADFDALPITEETDVPFKSKKDGIMHACGHDGHTAYMLILAETLIEMKDQLKGKIVILHQHAEEKTPGGAIGMIADGALDGVDNVFGIHVMSQMETGMVYTRPGNIQTGRAYFKAKIQGVGGHGSSPHLANDAIVAASYFVVAVQSIISRRLNPFDVGSITIGNFEGQGSFNVIKDAVIIEGDVRAMSEEVREIIETELKAKLDGIAAMFNVGVELHYENDYPVLYNDPEMTELVMNAVKSANFPELEAVEICDPQAPSEDFAHYAAKLPSCFFYVGAAIDGETAYPHHHPKFKINEDSLTVAAKSMAAVVVDYLSR